MIEFLKFLVQLSASSDRSEILGNAEIARFCQSIVHFI